MTEPQNVKPLPAKSRMARNINGGMEVWDGADEAWVAVTSALHILSPLAVSTFTLADGREFSAHPRERLRSRRINGPMTGPLNAASAAAEPEEI
jgi:hypothetical protein